MNFSMTVDEAKVQALVRTHGLSYIDFDSRSKFKSVEQTLLIHKFPHNLNDCRALDWSIIHYKGMLVEISQMQPFYPNVFFHKV